MRGSGLPLGWQQHANDELPLESKPDTLPAADLAVTASAQGVFAPSCAQTPPRALQAAHRHSPCSCIRALLSMCCKHQWLSLGFRLRAKLLLTASMFIFPISVGQRCQTEV